MLLGDLLRLTRVQRTEMVSTAGENVSAWWLLARKSAENCETFENNFLPTTGMEPYLEFFFTRGPLRWNLFGFFFKFFWKLSRGSGTGRDETRKAARSRQLESKEEKAIYSQLLLTNKFAHHERELWYMLPFISVKSLMAREPIGPGQWSTFTVYPLRRARVSLQEDAADTLTC